MVNEVDLCDRFIENFKIESLKSVQRDSLKKVSLHASVFVSQQTESGKV